MEDERYVLLRLKNWRRRPRRIVVNLFRSRYWEYVLESRGRFCVSVDLSFTRRGDARSCFPFSRAVLNWASVDPVR
jgi:hypothetical protein